MSWAKYKRLSSSKDLSIFRRGTTASDGGGGGGGNDPDAQAYIDALDAAGYTVSGAEETAINNHFLDLKGTGPNNSTYDWWTGIVRLLPFIGTNAAQQGIEGQNPASAINFYGGMTFSSIGAEGNGTNAYFDFFRPDELPDDYNNSIWVYSSIDRPTSGFQNKLYKALFDQSLGGVRYFANYEIDFVFDRMYSYHGDYANRFTSNLGQVPTTGGFFGTSRYNSKANGGGFNIYANGVQYTISNDILGVYNANTQHTPGLAQLQYGNVSSFSSLAFGYALITTGVSTTTEEAALRACVEAFMTALSRNV